MDRLLALICFLVGLAIVLSDFSNGAVAVLVTVALSIGVIQVIRTKVAEDKVQLIRIFLLALLVRLAFGLLINLFGLRDFFGADARIYDTFGHVLAQQWFGNPLEVDPRLLESRISAVGWGMYYLVGGIYSVTGRNPFAAQYFCATVGAAVAPLVFICAKRIFGNRRVAMISSMIIAVYPAMVVWSGQLLKDGLIVFLLVLSITMVLSLKERFSYLALLVLLGSLFAIFSLRSYIFFMIAVAIAGMFIAGILDSHRSIFASFVLLIGLGTTLTYFGAFESAGRDIERFTDLQKVQQSRLDLSRAGSGFGEDVDVSTTQGAIQAIPIGFAYLVFAPFPWQINNLRQLLTLPDMVVWYICLPFIVTGFGYALRKRLRETLGILIFVTMLTLAYSIFQGNVGTAYRQRTQIQVFLFMFAAVGITLRIEKRENAEYLKQLRQEQFEKNYRERERLRVTGV